MRALIFATLTLAFAACGGDDTNTKKDAGVVMDAPPGGPDANCFTNPTTNDEIINACTTAQKIYKSSHPALLNADGSLPPLP
jgi:hypothetical protein